MNVNMFRLTIPIVRSLLLKNKRLVVILLILSILIGVVPTLKSELEAGILQQASNIISSRQEGKIKNIADVFGAQLSYFSLTNSNSDLVQNMAATLFKEISLGIAFISYLVIAALASLISFVSNSAQQKISTQGFSELRGEGFRKGLVTDPSNLPSLPNVAGQYAIAIHQGASNVSSTYGYILEAGQYIFSLIITLILVATRSMIFAICILVVVIIQVIVSIVQAHRLKVKRTDLDAKRNDLVARTDDILDKREVILAYEQQNNYKQKLDGYTREYAIVAQELNIQEQKFGSINDLINDWGQITIIAIALILALFLSKNSISNIGDIYFLISIYARVLDPVSNILYRYDDVKRSEATSKAFLEVLENRKPPRASEQEKPPAENSTITPSNRTQKPCLKFVDVSLRYGIDTNAPWVLRNCNFEVPAYTTTLMVGRSGCGKSSIARIVLGFWPATSGEVFVEGKELHSWQPNELRELMSYVAQGDNIVDDSVRENLSWGYSVNKIPISNERMLEALVEVGIIKNVQEESILDARAKDLSGGQQQRLSVARMMLDESPIVILDEPLTGVDVFTLQELLPVLDKVLKRPNRTVFIFSHNLALATYAGHVIVLGDNGSVVEEGETKHLLIQVAGTFAKLYQTALNELQLK